MYVTTETYGTDHSIIFSMRVTSHRMVHSITYRFRWVSYPVYSSYSGGVFQERFGVECDITGTVEIIVTRRHVTVYYK
jgi:hypothetical protein